MIYLQSMIALDVARERSAEAEARSRRRQQLATASSARGARRGTLTSTLARLAAQASRGSAALAQRLDRPTADEILAPDRRCAPA